jgi:dTDP-glucose 4,6-dehydratase
MNILVTGGCGFIGSNFLNYAVLKYPNYKFINIDALYYCASINNIIENVKNASNYSFIEGNITDITILKELFLKFSITNIIHFAAQSHVDNSFEDSINFTEDNVKGTHTILEAIRLFKPDVKMLHFSTDEVYGESLIGDKPKNEMSLLCPTNPYAASKAAAEMFVNAYYHSYNIKCTITRCNNVYGPNQYPEKIIPKFILQLKSGNKCTIHGDGSAIRSFIHVYDVCTAVDTILHNGIIGEIYNIGSDEEHEKTVLEVAKELIKYIHNTDNFEDYIEYVTDRPFNDKRYFITNDKLKIFGWKQEIEFEYGIKELL